MTTPNEFNTMPNLKIHDPLNDNTSLVEYIEHMGSDLMVANMARVSLDKWHDEFTTVGVKENDAGMLKYMAQHQPVPHWSPFAHPQIQFRIRVPIFVARQWTRSNIGTTRNEVSRRYVDEAPQLYVPKKHEWRKRPEKSIKQGSGEHFTLDTKTNAKLHTYMRGALSLYNTLMSDDDVAPEMARMILPQNMYTMWIETGSLYYWYGFVKQRIDKHAQWEIQKYAFALNEIMHSLFPWAWKLLMDRERAIKKQVITHLMTDYDLLGEWLDEAYHNDKIDPFIIQTVEHIVSRIMADQEIDNG